MNSKVLKSGALLALHLLTTDAHRLDATSHHQQHQQGIFGKMIELATVEDQVKKEQHEATIRK